MPSKNSIGRYHNRKAFITKELWKKFVATKGIDISYEDFKEVIKCSLEVTKEWVLREPIGFQFPYKLGHLAVNKFKTYGKFKTYHNSRDSSGKAILNHNLHTGGYTYRIQMFQITRSYIDRLPYWHFVPERKFNRALAPILKSNKAPLYNSFMQDHFTKKYYTR